ncbi:MAG: elongation factor P maturation arginine rhamnosyltransferase EarP [Succinivibrionaceae bacterium]
MLSIDIFCKVVDNYGDIGVCYRLSKELSKNNVEVYLYVDNIESFNKISKNKHNVNIIKWDQQKKDFLLHDVIIEAFGCNLPSVVINKITKQNIWINLEYLSAENWIESCHKLPSLVNNNALKYFFFPGFTNKTGGLNYENHFITISKEIATKKINCLFSQSSQYANFFKVLIFSYDNNCLANAIEILQKIKTNILIFLPNSISNKKLLSTPKLKKILDNYYKNIKIIEFDMIDQDDFNYLLKYTDLNIVRGEDSITQAIITKTPFLWNIYPQADNAHINKLKSLIDQMKPFSDNIIFKIIYNTFLSFNTGDVNSFSINFYHFMLEYDSICDLNKYWVVSILNNKNLCNNLLDFIDVLIQKELKYENCSRNQSR